MVSFERGLLAAGLDPTIGLPYWDWTDGPDEQSIQLPRMARERNWRNGLIKGEGMLTNRSYFDYSYHA